MIKRDAGGRKEKSAHRTPATFAWADSPLKYYEVQALSCLFAFAYFSSLLRFFSVWPKHHPFSWFQPTFSLLYRVFVKFLRQICFLLHFSLMIHDITVHLVCEPLKVENATFDTEHLIYSKVCAWNMMDNNFFALF